LSDLHPPLPYLIFSLTGRVLGWSEIALRLPAFGFGILSIFLFYRLAQITLQNQRAALLAALLLALNPAHINYSNDARGYTLLICVVFWMLICIFGNRPARFVLAGVLAGFTHAYGFIYLSVFGLIALYIHRHRWRRWAVSITVTGLAVSVWIPVMIYQSEDVSNGFWLRPLTWAAPLWYLPGSIVGGNMNPMLGGILILLILVVSGLAVWSCRDWMRTGPGLALSAAIIAVPGLAAGLSVAWGHNIYLGRALLPAGLLIMLVYALWTVQDARAGYGLLCIMTVAIVAGTAVPREDVRGLLANCESADFTYAIGNHTGIIALYYSPVPVYVWPDANNRSQELRPDAKAALFDLRNFDSIEGRACIFHLDNYMVTEPESAQLTAILAAGHYTEIRLTSQYRRYSQYIVYVPGES